MRWWDHCQKGVVQTWKKDRRKNTNTQINTQKLKCRSSPNFVRAGQKVQKQFSLKYVSRKSLLRKEVQPRTQTTEKLFPDNSEFLQLGKKCEQRLQYGWLHYLIEMSDLLQCREGLVIKNDEFASTLAFQKYLAVFFSVFKTPFHATRWMPDKFFLLDRKTIAESKVFGFSL